VAGLGLKGTVCRRVIYSTVEINLCRPNEPMGVTL
jgi:hypothetical protein